MCKKNKSGIFTAGIDGTYFDPVNWTRGEGPTWHDRMIEVHGENQEDAEALRDRILNFLVNDRMS